MNMWWSQPVDGTLYLRKMECALVERRYHRGFTAAEKTELWDRWQRGEADLVLFIKKRERLMAQQVKRKGLIRCLVIR
jgi:hypothetical protein